MVKLTRPPPAQHTPSLVTLQDLAPYPVRGFVYLTLRIEVDRPRMIAKLNAYPGRGRAPSQT